MRTNVEVLQLSHTFTYYVHMENAKLFVGNLDYSTTEDELKEFFSVAGTVNSATIITDRDTGRSKGFGFVEMSSPEEAQVAIDQLDGKELNGRELAVSIARPREPRN